MKNPWKHNDVPDQSPYSSRGMRLLTLIVWGVFLIAIIGFSVFLSRGMFNTSNIGSLLTFLSVLLVAVVAIPILKKLLDISRLLAALALLVNMWVMFRLLAFREVLWAQSLLDEDPVDALSELSLRVSELFALSLL